MNTIIAGNAISGVGVFLLLFAQFKIAQSSSTQKTGLLVAALGSLHVTIGSFLLESYPIFALNAIWVCLSLYAYFKVDDELSVVENKKQPLTIIYLILAFAYIAMYINFDIAAYLVSLGYIASYIYYGRNKISRTDYLFYCAMISPATLPHLLDHFSYSVMTNEIIGICLCLYGWVKFQHSLHFQSN